VLEHILDTMLERGTGAGATRTGPAHGEINHALFILKEGDIATILRNGRTNARIEQVDDLVDNLVMIAAAGGMASTIVPVITSLPLVK